MIEPIKTKKATMPPGPYSQAYRAGNTIYVSGQVPYDPETGKPTSGGIKEQTRLTLENISAVLDAGGASLKNVVKVNAWLRDLKDFPGFNEVYKEYFKQPPYPARSTLQSAAILPEFLLEVEVIAVLS
jgi:2-iminobutanoate/2-iminopropanoate deaminase